ncbi:hypothetical protein KL938_000520 [Ogataea parapolymorpha]|nr:hypothetical protein KL938_000520 [Ogataea parapolymorpha]
MFIVYHVHRQISRDPNRLQIEERVPEMDLTPLASRHDKAADWRHIAVPSTRRIVSLETPRTMDLSMAQGQN